MNEELTIAIDELRSRPTDRTWFIPVLLNKTEIPARPISSSEDLNDFQMVNLYENWDEGINRIVRVLGHDDPVLRRIRHLSEIIDRPFDNERVHAINELGEVLPVKKPAVLKLLNTSKDRNREVRIASLKALAKVGKAAAEVMPSLVAVLKDPELYDADEAAGALAKIGPSATTAIVALITDGDQHILRIATVTLRMMGPAAGEVVPALLDIFKKVGVPDVRAQTAAAIALREIGSAAVPSLVAGLEHPDLYVRRAAVQALGMRAMPVAVRALAGALKDSERVVRLAAAQALGWPMAAEAVPALIASLKDPDLVVRRAVARALGDMGPAATEAVPALTVALEDPNLDVREETVEALRKIGPTTTTRKTTAQDPASDH
jgi:HEAT repeat protein